MEPYIFTIFGVFMFVAVVIAIIRVIKGTGNNAGTSSQGGYRNPADDETERLCRTLEADKLYDIAKGLEDEDGYKEDYSKWLSYMSAAAEKGYAPAQREIGLYHKYDDNRLAIVYLERAAEAGDGKAAAELCYIYRRGITGGTPTIEKDIDKAFKYATPLAEKGDPAAQKALAELYYYEKDDEKCALKWYLKAAEQGDLEAMHEAGDIYGFMDEMEKSKEMYLKAAEHGYAEAECSLGNYFTDVEPDLKKAMEWYKKASDHGDKFATCRVGEMYLNGEGVLKDAYAAVDYFQKAADEGSLFGKYLLGKCYFDGTGVTQDYKKAIELYKDSARYDADAQYALAMCYLTGEGVKKNTDKAVSYLTKACRDSMEAAYKLGEIYYNGEGVKKDEEKARDLWRRSARRGNKDAAESLKLYFGERIEGLKE